MLAGNRLENWAMTGFTGGKVRREEAEIHC